MYCYKVLLVFQFCILIQWIIGHNPNILNQLKDDIVMTILKGKKQYYLFVPFFFGMTYSPGLVLCGTVYEYA